MVGDPSLEEDDIPAEDVRMFLRKGDFDDEWAFSLVPFEELKPEDNVISYPSLMKDLDFIFEELNKNG
jgi:hypothetical protein